MKTIERGREKSAKSFDINNPPNKKHEIDHVAIKVIDKTKL